MAVAVKYNSKIKKYVAVVGKELVVSDQLGACCALVNKLGKTPRITMQAQKVHRESL